MFGVLRIIISIAVGLLLLAVLFKKKKVKLLFCSIIVFFCLLLTVVLGFIPFENLFYNFQSANEVYKYYYNGETSVDIVVEGKYSDFVVGTKNCTSTYLIVPKMENGWKIGIGLNTKRVAQKLSNGIVLYVYQYKDTSDYFITILDTNGGESTVSDEHNTKFFSLERYNDSLEKVFVTYYAHITNLNPQYSVIVNDNKIVLGNQ